MQDPFAAMLEVHDDFREGLVAHQVALVRGDLAAARSGFDALRADLEAHIRHEEEKILPVLERAGVWSRIGDPRFYREEHAKIRGLLRDIQVRTRALDAADPGIHRAIVDLLEFEHLLRSLLAHHDERERRALYPDVERLTRPGEWPELLRPPEA